MEFEQEEGGEGFGTAVKRCIKEVCVVGVSF